MNNQETLKEISEITIKMRRHLSNIRNCSESIRKEYRDRMANQLTLLEKELNEIDTRCGT